MDQAKRDAPTVGLGPAFLLMPAALLLLALVGTIALPWGLAGIAATQLVALAFPAWLVAARKGPPAAVLGLVSPCGRALAGAALLAASYWFVSAALVAPLVEHLFTEREIDQLAQQFLGPEPIAIKLLVIAVVPAVCEELLVRGAIARGLRPRLGLPLAAITSSAYFALLHGSLGRFPITFVLGLVLAVATLRSGSLLPAMLIHAGNNAAVVVLSQPQLAPAIDRLSSSSLAVVLLPGALLMSALGLSLVWLSRPTTRQGPW